MKTCSVCNLPKSEAEFYQRKASLDGLSPLCKTCNAGKCREYRKNRTSKSKEKAKEKKRKYARDHPEIAAAASAKYRKDSSAKAAANRAKYLYGVSPAEVAALFSAQGGVCAICKESVKLCIDHDHTTGKVRGLLCRKCNTGVGMLRESVTIVLAVYTYLKQHGK